jgi:hypothetical protein
MTAGGAPRLAGTVERVLASARHRGVVLLLDEPAAGYALVFLYTWEGGEHASVHAYLFGEDAAAVAAREEPRWRAWTAGRFPARSAAATTA